MEEDKSKRKLGFLKQTIFNNNLIQQAIYDFYRKKIAPTKIYLFVSSTRSQPEQIMNFRMVIQYFSSLYQCRVSGKPPRGKRVVICHADSSKGFVNAALFLRGKYLSESYVDYHQGMNGKVFEDWF